MKTRTKVQICTGQTLLHLQESINEEFRNIYNKYGNQLNQQPIYLPIND